MTAARIRNIAGAGFLALALVLGGGGPAAPTNMMVEIGAVALLAVLAAVCGASAPAPRVVLWVAVALIVLFALQLVPLPPELWRGLPGRELADAIRDDAGGAADWNPLSLDPTGTWATAFAVLPALAMFTWAAVAEARAQRVALGVVLAGALASLSLALAQAAAPAGVLLHPLATAPEGAWHGLFFNRNHQACMLAIGAVAGAGVLRGRSGGGMARYAVAFVGLAALLSLGVILTTSRAGVLLLGLASIAALAIGWPAGRRPRWRSMAAAAAGAAVLALTIGASLGSDGVLGRILARFATDQGTRSDYWPDVVYAIRQYLPWGSGGGTFDAVFRSVESLELLEPVYLNHAHNDYLEVAVEFGLPGVALVAVVLAVVLMGVWRVLRARRDPVAVAAAFIALAVLLHSIADYPLRTRAIAAVFGLACGILAQRRSKPSTLYTTPPQT